LTFKARFESNVYNFER